MSENAISVRQRRGGSFYVGMAAAMAITVFVGFAPTFYLRTLFDAPPISALVLLHGFLFSAWIAMLLAQTMLVASNRTDIHRRLGMVGAGLAAIMVVVGLLTALTAARLGHIPPGAPPPLSFFAIPFFAIVMFAILIGTGIARRSDPQTHKRLMLLGTIAILGAAIARLPFAAAGIPPVFFGIADLFVLAGVIHDWRANGRVHPAYVKGGLLIVLSQPVQLAIMGTGPWLAFAGWLVG